MRPTLIILASYMLIAFAAPGRTQDGGATAVAQEAVREALTLPPGYKRDVVLRTVSRNLRWFGQPDEGVRAARAMSEAGEQEVPPGTQPGPPRFVPLREAMPTGDPCDSGTWREEGGGSARTPKAREAWARRCLLTRDFHWIGLPEEAEVRTVAAALPDGDIKASVLAMLIRHYGDGPTLRFVSDQVAQARFAPKPRAASSGMGANYLLPI